MRITGEQNSSIDIDVTVAGRLVEIFAQDEPPDLGREVRVFVLLDENHAAALVLQLQAAIAEIQARAVGK